MYAMLIGQLPFTTPYTDHYRRLKLVQQMEKGLTEVHSREMSHLSQGNFCKKLVVMKCHILTKISFVTSKKYFLFLMVKHCILSSVKCMFSLEMYATTFLSC